ncbi:MAG: energy transducer TonB [Paludibacteraceae bacterium]|nr:energy transducer TonB [Paludibacteraceae bacterium]
MQLKKSKEASLENKKLTYLLLGFVFVLSLVYVALEWTDREVTKYDVTDMDLAFEEEIEIQQTQQEQPPQQIEQPKVQDVEVLKVVENEEEADEIEIKSEDDETEKIEIAAPVETIVEEEEDDQEIFVFVEKQPEFPGGTKALMKYLSENIKYPAIARENGISGKVICTFVVNKDGSIVDVEVVRSSGESSLDKEAVRVIKSMPKWSPGEQRNKPVRARFNLPVSFKLQ